MHFKDGVTQAPDAGRVTAFIRTKALNGLRVFQAMLVSALFWAVPAQAQDVAALPNTTCAADRAGGRALNCTASEFTVNAVVQEASGLLPGCTIGGSELFDVIVTLGGTNADRRDIGFFIGQDGNSPQDVGGQCSVATFPSSPLPWADFDTDTQPGDLCGDFTVGGFATPTIRQVRVACNFGVDPLNTATYGKLLLPYLVSFSQNEGDVCLGAATVRPANSSKCDAGVGTISGVSLTGYVDVTKQTLPNGDPTVFNFTTSGTAPFDAVNDTNFSLIDGQTRRISTLVDTTTRTITITEALTEGWSDTALITCLDYLGNPADTFVTIDGANRTFTASLDIAHPALACTITNLKGAPLTLHKTWVNAIPGNSTTVSATGGLNTGSLLSVAEMANETDDAALPILVNPGETITISEVFGNGTNGDNYAASIACTGNANPISESGQLLIGEDDNAIDCTVTNSRKSAKLTLSKTWENAVTGDTVTVSTDRASNTPSLESTATGTDATDSSGSVDVFAGEVITISEAFSAGLPGNYDQTLACTGNTNALAGAVLTVSPADVGITCGFTNARAPISLTVRKAWTNAIAGDAVTVSTTGGANTASVNSIASGAAGQIDAADPIEVFAGESIVIGESFSEGSQGNYLSTLACTGASATNNTLTVANGDGPIVCTLTNARRSATLTLAKTWVDAITGNAVNVSTTGAINNAAFLATADGGDETDTDPAPVTVFAGEVVTIIEAFTVGSSANYGSLLDCDGNNTVVSPENVLTVNPEDTAIACTFTNTRQSGTLTLRKQWQNARIGDAVNVSTSGGANAISVASTAASANDLDTGASGTILANETITIGETFSVGDAANYTSSLSCTGLAGDTSLDGNVLTVGSEPGNVVCTQVNARIQARLTLAKTWVNAAVNDSVTVSTTGGVNVASVASTATSPNDTDTGSAVTVFAGEQLTIDENFNTGSEANYTPTLACTGAGASLSNSTVSIGPTATEVVCTQTNTRRGASLTLRKTWVNAVIGNAVTVSTTGGANVASVASVAGSTNETDAGTAANVFAGETLSISESFSNGVASAFTSSLACTGNTNELAEDSLTISPADGEIVCTLTNSRILFPQLTVTKSATPGSFIIEEAGSYAVTVRNSGEAPTTGNITLVDNLLAGITLTSATGTNWSCIGTSSLSCTFTGTLAPGASTVLTLNVAVSEEATSGNNSATASGGGDTTCPAAARCTGTVEVPILYNGVSLQIVKTAAPVRVNAGSLVLYTLTITNVVNYAVNDAHVIDMPPNGLAYVPGSGTIHDGNDANNSVTGARPIDFGGVDVAVGETIRIQYLLRAGAALAAGEYTNYATAYRRNQVISNTASATVYAETGADPLLEQTRILGKVFDDQNGDGWQDPGERGIPGVRLASVEGLVSETDAFGRYHIEGLVLLNQERGQNFVLKLDPSTLPPGATVTTENPLLRRITAAIPARFDFGVKLPPSPAAQSSSVSMDLGEINFTPGSTEIRPEYQGVLDRMAEQIRTHTTGEVFIDSVSGSSPLAFERAGRVRDQLIERLSAEERNNFVITLRLQSNDGSTGEVSVSDVVKLGEVLFDTDKSVIKPEYEALLDRIAAQIEAVGAGRVTVVGHADLRGSVEYNQALGLRRANAVFDRIAQRLSPEARNKLSVEVEGAAAVPGAGQ